MKKYYILAFTFLCLLTGQNSYSQDWADFDDFLQEVNDAGGEVNYHTTIESFIGYLNNDSNPYNDLEMYTYVDSDLVGTNVTDWRTGTVGPYVSTTTILQVSPPIDYPELYNMYGQNSGDEFANSCNYFPDSCGTVGGSGETITPGVLLDDINATYSEYTINITSYNFEPGKNNIFNENGRPLRSGDTGDLVQIEINGVLYKPSQLARTEGSMAALNKIAAFYAQSKGYSGLVKTINLAGDKGGDDVAFYGNGVLTVRSLAFAAGKFDNVRDFKSVINHEVLHWKDPRNDAPNYTSMDHANIYLKEASDPEFNKTSINYKLNNANQYMVRVLNAARANVVGMNNAGVIAAINKYNNENVGGIQIYDFLFSSAGFDKLTFSTRINGIPYDNKYEYEELNSPRD